MLLILILSTDALNAENTDALNKLFTISGNNIVFIYPDMKTVLIGRFDKRRMIAAKPSKILAERCNKGIKEIKVAKPKEDAPILTYSRPNRLRIGDQPRVMDPFTKKNIYIGNGTKDDGVFAKRDMQKGDLVMYYSGLFWNETEQSLFTMDAYKNQTWDEYWAIFRNLISFDGPLKIHIPEPYWNISNFRATLGHKVNHSFKSDKTVYGKAYHPRFGNVRSVYAKEYITKGEEIYIDYKYGIGRLVPEWVSDLYRKEMGKKWYGSKSKWLSKV